MVTLSCEALTLIRDGRPVLDTIDLTFPPGGLIAIVGPNGAGKSALVAALLGRVPPSSGRVLVDGMSAPASHDIAAYEDVRFGSAPPRAARAVLHSLRRRLASRLRASTGDAARHEAAMRAVDAWPLRDRTPETLSGGERARVQLARAIANGAPALIADDPFAALDPPGQEELMAHLAAHAGAAAGPVIVTMRDAAIAARFCTRLVLLERGCVVADGRPDDVLGTPAIVRVYAASSGRAETAAPPAPVGTPSPMRPSPRPEHYLAPIALERSDDGPERLLLVGACFLFNWPALLARAGHRISIDKFLFANVFPLPDMPPHPLESYDLQLVQVPLPTAVPERDHIRLAYDDEYGHEHLLEESVARLELFLKQALKWSHSIPTLVMNYLVPQQNLLGRLMPRYDLRNPIYFAERINEELARLIGAYPNVHLLDVNHIASVCGRRYLQEDALYCQYHGGLMENNDLILEDKADLDRSRHVSEIYDIGLEDFVSAVWREARAMYRTLRGIDSVKLVCVDLDNTLWRGVIGEMGDLDAIITVGWPMGLAEVLVMLRKRGIVLAIISKNDEARVRAGWDTLFGGILRLDDFAIVKINWKPKAENMAEVLEEANLLPGNVVFVDDNPVECAAVTAAFPEIRTIGTLHFHWRRILGWSAELQVPAISDESARRSELIRARIDRTHSRAALTRDAFLATLDLRMRVNRVPSPETPGFARAFELINKTNQFNTTGRRWSHAEAAAYLAGGGMWWAFDVVDRFADHGLVGVICLRDGHIDQFVMSCRVAGLDLEPAALAAILTRAKPRAGTHGGGRFSGAIVATDANAVVRDVYARLDWSETEAGLWVGDAPAPASPHVAITVDLDGRSIRGLAPPIVTAAEQSSS